MDELIRMVSERAGISEEAARTAVNTVLSFLKDRLPEPLAGQLNSVLSGQKIEGGDIGGALGGILGRR